MSTTLKTLLVVAGVALSSVAVAGAVDTSSRGAAIGSCHAIATSNPTSNADIHAFRELLQRKGQRLQGMEKVQYNQAYVATLSKPKTQQDLMTCAKMLDAGQI